MIPLALGFVFGPAFLVSAWAMTMPGGTTADLLAELRSRPGMWALALAACCAFTTALAYAAECGMGIGQ